MEAWVVNKILDLNHQFYQNFAGSFSATRQRLQPGVLRILAELPAHASVLDLGCGNGGVTRALANREFGGAYLGLDSSESLLEEARISSARFSGASFMLADLSEAGWDERLPTQRYDWILAFAVLHHMPGEALRQNLLSAVRSLMAPGGRFVHSEWQFLNSSRLRERIQPWERAGLTSAQVDPGDYLLDWRSGGYGLRYVHHFSQDELSRLAASCGFHILESFASDGESRRLGLYQAWEAA